MEKTTRNPHAMAQRMTGMEAYRVLYHCLKRWHKITNLEYLEFLHTSLTSNISLWSDWEDSIQDMIKERDGDINYDAFPTYGTEYHHCKCQDKDSWEDTYVVDVYKDK